MDETHCVLSVGRFIPSKGFDLLMRAAAQLPPDVGVYIVGGEPPREYVDLREQLDLRNVHFIEFLGENQLRDYYDAADVFVLPTRGDAWGLVINEAMARALPVVTTNQCVAGLEMVVDGVNGFIVPSEDVDSLAHTLKSILSDSDFRSQLASASLERARMYTIETMAGRHLEIFSELVESELLRSARRKNWRNEC